MGLIRESPLASGGQSSNTGMIETAPRHAHSSVVTPPVNPSQYSPGQDAFDRLSNFKSITGSMMLSCVICRRALACVSRMKWLAIFINVPVCPCCKWEGSRQVY
jgi:hypothetical protein